MTNTSFYTKERTNVQNVKYEAALQLYRNYYKQFYYITYYSLPVTQKSAEIVRGTFTDVYLLMLKKERIPGSLPELALKILVEKIISEYRESRRKNIQQIYFGLKKELMKLSEAERLTVLITLILRLDASAMDRVIPIKDGVSKKLASAAYKLRTDGAYMF